MRINSKASCHEKRDDTRFGIRPSLRAGNEGEPRATRTTDDAAREVRGFRRDSPVDAILFVDNSSPYSK